MASRLPLNGYVLGLDVGQKRIGVAISSAIAKLPQPLSAIPGDETSIYAICKLINELSVTTIVVGLPRNMDGQETAQSQTIRDFAADLSKHTSVPLQFADESLSSVRADRLSSHTKFKNVSADSLAACFILEEFFNTINNESL